MALYTLLFVSCCYDENESFRLKRLDTFYSDSSSSPSLWILLEDEQSTFDTSLLFMYDLVNKIMLEEMFKTALYQYLRGPSMVRILAKFLFF